LASGSADNTVKFWDIASLKEVETRVNVPYCQAVAFSPDGKLFANGLLGGTILLDMSTHNAVTILDRCVGFDLSVTFSPDGKLLASGGEDGTIALWDMTPFTAPRPPVVSGIPDQTIEEGKTFASIKLDDYVSDPDNIDSEIKWSYSGNTKLNVNIDANRVAVITIPDPEWNGSETITFTAKYPGGLSASDSAKFTVTPVNDPPVVTDIPGQTIEEGKAFASIKLDDYVSDPDNPDSEITWTYTGNTMLNVNIDANRVAFITASDPEWNGSEIITFTAKDPGGLTASDSAKFTVTPVNDPPVVTDIPGQTIEEGKTFALIRLDDYVYDPDNADTEITWTYAGNISLSVVIDENRVVIIKAPDSKWNGSETITFTATDPSGLSDSDSAKFIVIPVNDPPVVADIPGQTIEEGKEFVSIKLDDYVSDPDNKDAEIKWTFAGNTKLNVSVDANRVANITVSEYRWSGSETIAFIATDPGGLSASDSAKFTVTPLEFEPGDVNKDGVVRSSDAIMALRISVGLLEPTYYQKVAADMNRDGKVKSDDVILILKKSAGLAAPGAIFVAKSNERLDITMGDAHGIAGETITVPVIISNPDILLGGDICIAYDNSVIHAVNVLSVSDTLLVSDLSDPGIIRIAFACPDVLTSKTLAEIQFKVIADSSSPLSFKSIELYNANAQPLTLTSVDGKFISWAMMPDHSALLMNYPNPFNPDTWIPYRLKEESDVSINIYDVAGRLVRQLNLGIKPAGVYISKDRAAYWDGCDDTGQAVASGIYFCTLKAGSFQAVSKMVIVR